MAITDETYFGQLQKTYGGSGAEKPLTNLATLNYGQTLKNAEYQQKLQTDADKEMIEKKNRIKNIIVDLTTMANNPDNPMTTDELMQAFQARMAAEGVSEANMTRIYPMASTMIMESARYGGEKLGELAGGYFGRQLKAGAESVGLETTGMTRKADLDRYAGLQKADIEAKARMYVALHGGNLATLLSLYYRRANGQSLTDADNQKMKGFDDYLGWRLGFVPPTPTTTKGIDIATSPILEKTDGTEITVKEQTAALKIITDEARKGGNIGDIKSQLNALGIDWTNYLDTYDQIMRQYGVGGGIPIKGASSMGGIQPDYTDPAGNLYKWDGTQYKLVK